MIKIIVFYLALSYYSRQVTPDYYDYDHSSETGYNDDDYYGNDVMSLMVFDMIDDYYNGDEMTVK